MRILVHHPSVGDGTSFYRAFGPFSAIQRKHPEIHITDSNDFNIGWSLLRQYDVVFMQRPASKYQYEFAKMAKDYGIPVWVDWDDHYLDIPDSNPRKKFYTPHHIEQVREIAKLADVVTVSTDFLKNEFLHLNRNVKVLRNAHDFDLLPEEYAVNAGIKTNSNLILWRGSDTHQEDLDHYKDEIIQLMDETQDYVWGFFGHYPKWAVDHLPSNRIRLYGYDGVVEYIKRMVMMRPHMVFIPLCENYFNLAKSNIGWIEATYAGAVTVMPLWPEWHDLPGYHYTGKEDFKQAFKYALNLNVDRWGRAWGTLTSDFRLESVNQKRMDILEELTTQKPDVPIDHAINMPDQFTDKEFFDYNKARGWIAENPDWEKGQDKLAEYLTGTLAAKSVIDIGCGSGALLEALMRKNIPVMGIDSNKYNYEYFVKRNPEAKERFILDEAQNVCPGNHFDVVVSIEVFEHIPDEINEQILENLRDKCTWFLFTSTPYHSTPQFDRQWGHINVKPTPHWIKFFEERGFKLVQELDFPTKWALLFISTSPKK